MDFRQFSPFYSKESPLFALYFGGNFNSQTIFKPLKILLFMTSKKLMTASNGANLLPWLIWPW